ncbi:MAG: LTA synthase family protein [Atopobiaceae bacterium]|nr:LTA synthase family protein [Atopobiaceae bacterium]
MSAEKAEETNSELMRQASHRRTIRIAGLALLGLLAVTCVLAYFVEQWLFDTWAALSVDEIIYHLSVSLEGADTSTIGKFLREYAPYALVVLIEMAIVLYVGFKRGGKHAVVSVVTVAVVSLGLLGYAFLDASQKTNLDAYLEGMATWKEGGEDFIGTNYVNPSDVDIEFPEQKRNLIYIFLESMEMTYADEASGGAFEKNAIPQLTKLAQENEDFSGSDDGLNGGLVFSGTDWTMGGMFAQTSGTPLKVPLSGFVLEDQGALFPGMTTLGDILKDQGYHQELLLGSDATFGGRRSYFSTHGDYEMYDYNWALENGFIPEDYHVFWGFEDEKLFELARERLNELAQQDEPFNLTLLTVDTHFEDGYVCDLCRKEFGDNQYANVMACSSRQVSKFVEWVTQQDFYENTTIVVSGDHTTMDKDFCADVPEEYQRRTYTAVINPAVRAIDPALKRDYATFDLFPTTLAALGATIPGERLGIGTNLFSMMPTLVEHVGVETCARELTKQSELLSGFSKIEVSESYMKRAAKGTTLDVKVLKASGRLNFFLGHLVFFERGVFNDPKLRVTDTRTGETTEFAMKVVQRNPNDPNAYDCYAKTTFGEEDLPYLRAEALVSVGDFTDYVLVTREAEIDASEQVDEQSEGSVPTEEEWYEEEYYDEDWDEDSDYEESE